MAVSAELRKKNKKYYPDLTQQLKTLIKYGDAKIIGAPGNDNVSGNLGFDEEKTALSMQQGQGLSGYL